MKRQILWSLLTTLTISISAQAGWPEFHHSVHVGQARNKMWPQPFRAMDARGVVSPFDVMRDNGWRNFNTLGTPLFSETCELTPQGRLQVEWILTKAPANRRTIFVHQGKDTQETASRVEAVQLLVSEMLPVGELPPIYVTDIEPYVSNGQRQTNINRSMETNFVQPVLPKFSSLNAPANQAMTSATK